MVQLLYFFGKGKTKIPPQGVLQRKLLVSVLDNFLQKLYKEKIPVLYYVDFISDLSIIPGLLP